MNSKTSKELALYFDMLRHNRRISQERFTDGIVSLRQYRRYINGSCSFPYKIISLFCDRLGLKLENILMDFESERLRETIKINNLYNTIMNESPILADELIARIDENHIIDSDNQTLYAHIINFRNYYKKIISETEIIELTMELIDFKTVFKKHTLSTLELLILTSLLSLPNFQKKEEIAEKIVYFVNNVTMATINGNNKNIIIILEQLAEYYLSKNNYERVIFYCQKGITYNNKYKSYFLQSDLYYYLAISFYELGMINDFENIIINCYIVLKIDLDDLKYNKLENLVLKYSNASLEDFIYNRVHHYQTMNSSKNPHTS